MTWITCGRCNGRILEDSDGTIFCIQCGWQQSNITEIDVAIEAEMMYSVAGTDEYAHRNV